MRVGGGGSRVIRPWSARDQGDRRWSCWSLVDMDKLVTKASGEMYPERGTSHK